MTENSSQHKSFGTQAVAARDTGVDLTKISGEIIVGIDGSEQSYGALIWAVHEAKRRGVPVRLVTAYSLPVFTGTGFDAGYSVVDEEALRDGVAQILDEAISRVGETDVELRATVETCEPSARRRQILTICSLERTSALQVEFRAGSTAFASRHVTAQRLSARPATAEPSHRPFQVTTILRFSYCSTAVSLHGR